MDAVTNAAPEELLAPNYVRRAVSTTVKAKNDGERSVLHLISSGSVDRAGDVVEPRGAQTGNYLKNPVVMANHDYRIEQVVGRAVSLTVEDGGLFARTQFRDTPLGLDAYRLASEGLGGWSIGFRPIEYESMKDERGRHKGFRFDKWELLEYSIVAIPMNQDAVQNMITRGLVTPENVPAFFLRSPEGPSAGREPSSPAPKAAPLAPALLRELVRTNRRLALLQLAADFDAAAEVLNA